FSSGSGVAVGGVFVLERGRESPVGHQVGRRVYGLTDPEAAGGGGGGGGRTPRQRPAGGRPGSPTGRTPRRATLWQTGAGRQAELVRQILHGPAVLVPARPPVRDGIGHVIDLPSRRRQAIR